MGSPFRIGPAHVCANDPVVLGVLKKILKRELKKWKGLTPGMRNPIHVGPQFKIYSKEELHER